MIPSISEQIEAVEECIEVYRKSFTHAVGEHDGQFIDPKTLSDIARLEAAVATLKRASARKVRLVPSLRMKSLRPHVLGIFWCWLIAACIGFSARIILSLVYHTPAEFSRWFVKWNGFYVYSFVNVFLLPASIIPAPHSNGYWYLAHMVAYYTFAPLFWGFAFYSILRLEKLVVTRMPKAAPPLNE